MDVGVELAEKKLMESKMMEELEKEFGERRNGESVLCWMGKRSISSNFYWSWRRNFLARRRRIILHGSCIVRRNAALHLQAECLLHSASFPLFLKNVLVLLLLLGAVVGLNLVVPSV